MLVRISAAGVNPVETYIRAGAYATLPQLPYTPGGDAAGTVEAVGAGVTSLAVGDRVYTGSGVGGGAYAGAGVFPASTVHKLPEQASFAQVPLSRSVWHRVSRAHSKSRGQGRRNGADSRRKRRGWHRTPCKSRLQRE